MCRPSSPPRSPMDSASFRCLCPCRPLLCSRTCVPLSCCDIPVPFKGWMRLLPRPVAVSGRALASREPRVAASWVLRFGFGGIGVQVNEMVRCPYIPVSGNAWRRVCSIHQAHHWLVSPSLTAVERDTQARRRAHSACLLITSIGIVCYGSGCCPPRNFSPCHQGQHARASGTAWLLWARPVLPVTSSQDACAVDPIG